MFCRNRNGKVINLTHNVEHEKFFFFHTPKECKKQITLAGKMSAEYTLKIYFGLETLAASLSQQRLMLVFELVPWTSKVKTDTDFSRT